ncbi:MAG TPA: hypothetical protein VK729_09370 [Silvibacterium sp.]|jgi:hypothetical protein|nr:hypothetical protein [Silvibacterium sp.]
MPTEEEIRKIRTHAVWEEAKLDLDLEWDTFDVVVAYGCEVMDQTKSLEKAYEAVDDQLQAWKDAEREMARFSKELEDRQAAQLVREQMSLRAALRAPTLAANVGKGMNNAATMGATLKGIDDRRKAQDEYQARLAYLYAAREKRLNNLKGRFANIFHYMEPDDLARPSCIANLGDDLLRSISTSLGQHRVKNFHAVLMGGGYMCMLPYEVDYFELKLGPEICRDWLEPRTGHGFPVARIKESWESAKRLDLKPRQTYGNLAFDIGKTRLITSADKRCVITYFLES